MLENALCLAIYGVNPNDGLNPKTPHHAEGILIDPPASVPSAIVTNPSATAAALPPEEPPEFLF